MTKTHEYITETATDTTGLNNRQCIAFHYFNPNGLYAESVLQQEKIMSLVKSDLVKSGWLVAYDDNFYYKEMNRMIKKKRVGSTELYVLIKMWREHIDSTNERISTVNLGRT